MADQAFGGAFAPCGGVGGGCFIGTVLNASSAMSESERLVGGGAFTGTAEDDAWLGSCGASSATGTAANNEMGGAFAGADSLTCERNSGPAGSTTDEGTGRGGDFMGAAAATE